MRRIDRLGMRRVVLIQDRLQTAGILLNALKLREDEFVGPLQLPESGVVLPLLGLSSLGLDLGLDRPFD